MKQTACPSSPGAPGSLGITIEDLDFARLYRNHMARSARPPKRAEDWDARARAGGMSRSGASGYAGDFVSRMDLGGARTLLDVGCGPGTICLPLAGRLERVYGLDYSVAMLDALCLEAAQLGVENAVTIRRAWEDDWSDVPVCDIAVASRASNVADLDAALDKLSAHARLRGQYRSRARLRRPDGGSDHHQHKRARTGTGRGRFRPGDLQGFQRDRRRGRLSGLIFGGLTAAGSVYIAP